MEVAKYQANTNNVQLRGVHIKGNYEDLPNLIFFPQILDSVESWIPFFSKPEYEVHLYLKSS